MNYTVEEEQLAKQEYLQLMESLFNSDDFKNNWKGHWEDEEKEAFGRKKVIKGDKNNYMKYWLANKEILNDANWNKIEDDGDF